MRRLAALLCASLLPSSSIAQETNQARPLAIVEITGDEAARSLMFLQRGVAGIQLQKPPTTLEEAARMVEAEVVFRPPKRIAQHGEWIFLPRLEAPEDDLSFESGFALKLGQRHLLPWQRNAIVLSGWDFEGPGLSANNPAPSQGRGEAVLFGGVGADFKSGGGIRSRQGWNTSGYPPQGNASGTRGVVFRTDTSGFSNIVVQFDQRSSKTGSRWSRFDYTADGRNFVPFQTNNGALTPPDTCRTYRFDLSTVPGVNDNKSFGFRIVSIFSPRVFQQNASSAVSGPDAAYMRASEEASYEVGQAKGRGDYGMEGSWRFDNVRVTGVPVDARSEFAATARIILLPIALAALLAAAVLWLRRRGRAKSTDRDENHQVNHPDSP